VKEIADPVKLCHKLSIKHRKAIPVRSNKRSYTEILQISSLTSKNERRTTKLKLHVFNQFQLILSKLYLTGRIHALLYRDCIATSPVINDSDLLYRDCISTLM
jgi:hypothetical protein